MARSTTRRDALKLSGVAAMPALAGCSGILSSGLDVSIANKVDESADYDVRVGDFERSGSLEGADSDTFEGVIDEPTRSETLAVSGTFGGSAFDDQITIERGHDKIVLSNTPMGLYISASADE